MTGVPQVDAITTAMISLLGLWMVLEIGIRWALAAFRRTTNGAGPDE